MAHRAARRASWPCPQVMLGVMPTNDRMDRARTMSARTTWSALITAVVLAACLHVGPKRARNRNTPVTSYAGPNDHTMIVIPGGEFVMGSPPGAPGRSVVETQHRVRIPRAYAIATTEVTNEEFARFLLAVPEYAARWRRATAVRFGDPPRFAQYSRTPDSPQVGVSWYDA